MVEYGSKLEQLTMRWEDDHVIARDRSMVDIWTAKAIAVHVVELMGLPIKAPTVRRVDEGDEDISWTAEAMAAMSHDGTMMMFYRPQIPTTVVLHELAHLSVNDPLDAMELRKPEELEMHGPVWLSNYLWLLDKLMGPGYNTFYLRGTMPPELNANTLPFHPTIWGQPRIGL